MTPPTQPLGAIVGSMKRRHIIRVFRNADATSPETAHTLME